MSQFNKQKAFGQHFLVDQAVIKNIVDATVEATNKNPNHSLLEIGPGRGAITRPLITALPFEVPFYLAERDRELIEYWLPESRLKKILKGDFLNQSDEELDSLGKLVIVSNLPYSAGTAIVVRLAERAHQIAEMILMFQAEVAKRLYSGPSTPDRGSLSLYIQNEWDVEKLMVVKPQAFDPPPKVMSEVIKLTRRKVARIDVSTPENRKRFNELLKIGFKHRRKMIRGNFAGTAWANAFQKSGLDGTKRAESLEWEEWIQLWKSF